MNPTILDMRAIAAQETFDGESFLDRLITSLRNLPEPSADELLDRAAAYADSQPSFAADLRAAAEAQALA